ncbi:gas vesicle protein [Actinomycetospora soli]|uniref:gas vesicle protein n=1 Tax=Actinomycetospora soli TaxID=2893887 RepID=UPI001E424502|nr:gas vesicle protein [Actinomycetospora soli]MCD2190347.1 gas vesicle protein [Actinomycetospora soli]
MTVEHRETSLFGDREVALVDLLDRLLAGGVVLTGDLTISLAGVDLVRISLRALITSIAPAESGPIEAVRSERVVSERVGSDRLVKGRPDG